MSRTLLAATADGATTFYLPGIGEEKQDWSYYLYDGTNSARQLSGPGWAGDLDAQLHAVG